MDKKEDYGPSLWTNFTETTGFHGLNKMTFDKKYPGRVVRSAVWAAVWLVCATVLIYIILTQLMNYYSYPSLSSTYLRFDQQLPFPVVTVCTENPMDLNTLILYFDQDFVGHSEIPVLEYTDFYFYETAYMCGCACRRFNAKGTFLRSQHGISSGLLLETTSTELQYKSLPSPYIAYGNQICIDDADYSFVDCKRKCYNEMLMKECSCTMNPSPTGNETYCVDDYLSNTCAAELYGDILYSSTLCVCPPECRVIKYDQVLSSVANINDYQSHYLRIQIYLKDLSTTVTEQFPKYDGVTSLLANLGGQMGLFLGASILTITELLEFIIFILWTVIQRRTKGNNVVQNISKDI